MKKILNATIIGFMLSAILFTTGCKKTSVNGLVKTKASTTGTNAQVTTSYTYDSQGRLINLNGPNGNFSATYSQNSIVVTSTTTATNTYTLNPQGLVQSDLLGNSYVYDNNGYLTQQTNSTTGDSYAYTISGGDVQTETATVGGARTTITYTYLTDVDYRNYGQAAFGKNSVNLLKSEIVTSNGTSVTYTFSYNKDSQGRVSTETILGSDGSTTTNVFTYTS